MMISFLVVVIVVMNLNSMRCDVILSSSSISMRMFSVLIISIGSIYGCPCVSFYFYIYLF